MKRFLMTCNLVLLPLLSFAQTHFSKNWTGDGIDLMSFSITSATINGTNMVAGDEIAVFDGGACVGVSVLTQEVSGGSPLAIDASRDDAGTPETDGYMEDNTYTIRVWDESASEEISDVAISLSSGSSTFAIAASAILGIAATGTPPPNTPPELSDIPDQSLGPCEIISDITLDSYITDAETAIEDITWTFSGNIELGVVITDRVASITAPSVNWFGSETITFTATDDDATNPLNDADALTITVAQMQVPQVGAVTQATCAVQTGSVALSGLPESGDWILTESPGAAEYTGSGSSTTLTDLASGTYTYTVTNADGCLSAASDEVVIEAAPTVPTAPVPGTTIQPTCTEPTGSVELEGLPAAGDWTLSMQPGDVETIASGSTTTISGLNPGTYTFTVTNADGCVSDASADVIIMDAPDMPSAPQITAITQTSCSLATGSVDLGGLPSSGTWTLTMAPGGTTTTGSGETIVIDELPAGAYTFSVTNEAGCSSVSSDDAVINPQPPTPSAPSLGAVTQPNCYMATGSVDLSGLPLSGNWTLSWDAGSGSLSGTGANTSISSLSTGTYSFSVTNEAGCTSLPSGNVVINAQPEDPDHDIELPSSASACEGQSVELDAGSGFDSYLWSTGATTQTISVDAGGNYSVSVSQGDCSSSATSEVWINALPRPDLGADQAFCQGESVVLDPGNFASYQWTTGATTGTISASASGSYAVTVSDGTCSNTDEISITVHSLPQIPLDASYYSTTCITLDAGADGSTYLWSTGATTQTIEVCSSGTYSVNVRNSQGCSDNRQSTVTIGDVPVVDLPESLEACEGEVIELDAGAGFSTYLWSTGATTQTIEVTASDTYSVTVSNSYGEEATDQVTVTYHSIPDIDLGAEKFACEGDTVELDAGEGFVLYAWSTGESTSTIRVTEWGDYTVTVSNGYCMTSASVQVSLEPLPELELGAEIRRCQGETVTLDAGAGHESYLWSTGDDTRTIDVQLPGSYAVRVDQGICHRLDTVQVAFVEKDTVNLGPDIEVCTGTPVILDAGEGFEQYGWSTGEQTSTITITESGAYSVSCTHLCGSSTDEVYVNLLRSPEIDLGPDSTINAGEQITLDAGPRRSSYAWSTGDFGRTILLSGLPVGAHTYWVTVAGSNACTASDTIVIYVELGNSVHELPGSGEIAIYPNPAGDRIFVKSAGDIPGTVALAVYDGTGRLILRDDYANMMADWPIKIDLTGLQRGVYFLRLQTEDGCGTVTFLKE